MKKLTYFFLALLIVACSDDDSDLGNNQNCLSLLTDKTWFPVEGTSEIFTYVRFDSNGDFYEEGELDGTWALESNCNTINFEINESNIDFSYDIVSINQNLMVVNTILGQVTYENFYVEGGSFGNDYNGVVWKVEEINGEVVEDGSYIIYGLNNNNEFQSYFLENCEELIDYGDVYDGYASVEIIIDDGNAMIFRYIQDIEPGENGNFDYFDYILKVKSGTLSVIVNLYDFDDGIEYSDNAKLSITNLDNPCE